MNSKWHIDDGDSNGGEDGDSGREDTQFCVVEMYISSLACISAKQLLDKGIFYLTNNEFLSPDQSNA
jgi:hypothetical protein